MKKGLIGCLFAAMALSLVFAAETNVAGDWKITMKSPRGEHINDMKIVQDGEKLQVFIQSTRHGEQSFQGTINGVNVIWSSTRKNPNGSEATTTYKGKVDGETMKGTVEMSDRDSFEWNATRVK